MGDEVEEVQRVLDAVTAFATNKEPPAERARKLAKLRDAVALEIRRELQRAVREMSDRENKSYRAIGDELGISFGRVRQILAEDLSEPPEEHDELET
ncbi:hypothetical protein [Streptomyces europaeiscabiei]|uniref:hypothetical protein n=1 Tax=Streptomyces europaeiscabiei TaxID=146819 RepID=UPI002E1177ED|nr:hypothetical protein OHB30_33045 [Streptomyces europaeiscabiei]